MPSYLVSELRAMIKKICFFLVLLFLGYLVVVLIYATYHDYQPDEKIIVSPDLTATAKTIDQDTLKLLTWNIGYSGLGAESDFFYADGRILLSGGMMIRPPEAIVKKNVDGILKTIKEQSADIFLLQEVDIASKRSYYFNQYEAIGQLLPGYESTFGDNLRTAYSPVPLLEPWRTYGYTHSGIATFARYSSTQTIRYQLPGKFHWPNRLFLLDRCVLEHRFPVKNGKELIIYNIHNSAYDQDGSIKKQQTAFLKERWLAEYGAGNYVIAGGDWNQVPPFLNPNIFRPDAPKRENANIDSGLMPDDWRWIYDPMVPTVRDTREIYKKDQTFTGLIDFFLLSPNLRALQVKGVDLDFQYSDHQPVSVKVVLK